MFLFGVVVGLLNDSAVEIDLDEPSTSFLILIGLVNAHLSFSSFLFFKILVTESELSCFFKLRDLTFWCLTLNKGLLVAGVLNEISLYSTACLKGRHCTIDLELDLLEFPNEYFNGLNFLAFCGKSMLLLNINLFDL